MAEFMTEVRCPFFDSRVAPIVYSSGGGVSRTDHYGQDIIGSQSIEAVHGVSRDTSVAISPVNGEVQAATYHNSYGNYVDIKITDGPYATMRLRIAHFAELFVSKGAIVTVGTRIGLQGKTGSIDPRGDGRHLHIELYRNGEVIWPNASNPTATRPPIALVGLPNDEEKTGYINTYIPYRHQPIDLDAAWAEALDEEDKVRNKVTIAKASLTSARDKLAAAQAKTQAQTAARQEADKELQKSGDKVPPFAGKIKATNTAANKYVWDRLAKSQ